MRVTVFLLCLFGSLAAGVDKTGSHLSRTFATATKYMMKVGEAHPETIYCRCTFDQSKVVDRSSCGLVPKGDQDTKRYEVVEAEHVVPANILCGKTPAWTSQPSDGSCGSKTGRDCAATIEPCSYAYTDLHNLWPASGGVNNMRSDKRFVESVPGPANYGRCQFKENSDYAEIADYAKGIAGRVSLYMYEAYKARGLPVDFSAAEIKVFKKWNCAFPPEKWECERNEQANELQGNYNHVTWNACQKTNPDCRGKVSVDDGITLAAAPGLTCSLHLIAVALVVLLANVA